MTKLEMRKYFVITIGILLLSIVILGGALLLFLPKNNKEISLLSKCPYFISEKINVGKTIDFEDIKLPLVCRDSKSIKKVTELYYDYSGNLVVKVRVINSLDDNKDIYDITNYNDEYIYTYTKNDNILKLSKIES